MMMPGTAVKGPQQNNETTPSPSAHLVLLPVIFWYG